MAASKKEKPDLQTKVHEVPHKPGVYLMRDRFNRVIYVGKARDLRKRVGSYFLPSKLAQADLKTRAMLDATWDFETHTVRSEAESSFTRRQTNQGIPAPLQHFLPGR
jgi:Nuclease subunit of the excinuclease complex